MDLEPDETGVVLLERSIALGWDSNAANVEVLPWLTEWADIAGLRGGEMCEQPV